MTRLFVCAMSRYPHRLQAVPLFICFFLRNQAEPKQTSPYKTPAKTTMTSHKCDAQCMGQGTQRTRKTKTRNTCSDNNHSAVRVRLKHKSDATSAAKQREALLRSALRQKPCRLPLLPPQEPSRHAKGRPSIPRETAVPRNSARCNIATRGITVRSVKSGAFPAAHHPFVHRLHG